MALARHEWRLRASGLILAEARGALGALLIAMVLGSLLILAYGQAPAHIWGVLARSTWGMGYGIGQVLAKATPLLFAGLGVALALRAGLLNVGAEGQLLMGAFASALVGAHCQAVPSALAIGLALIVAACAGGLYGAIAGVLKILAGAHEVITTILLNFIAVGVLSWVGSAGGLFLPETQHTAPIAAASRVARLGTWIPALQGSAGSAMLLVGLGLCVLGVGLLYRTRFGYELRAVGLAPPAAEAAGISVPRVTLVVMVLSGALAGLGGASFVLGYKYYFEQGFATGAGFTAVAVAVLGRSHPLGVIGAALLFGTLSQGGLAINHLVPKDIMDMLVAVVILGVAVATERLGRRPA